jgi:hypothetical protein
MTTKGISLKEIQKTKATIKRCRQLRQELKGNTTTDTKKGRELWKRMIGLK